MKKKHYRRTGPLLLLLLLAVLAALFSGYKVYTLWQEYRQGEESYEQLSDRFVISTPELPHITIPAGMEEPLSETAPIAIAFDELLAECGDVVGWLYCADTPINYPVVQSSDNEYYLRRLLDGSYHINGTIFLDYRNSPDFSDWNSIIYGHNMKNDTMFGTLQKYKEQSYYEDHPVWYLLTPEKDYKIELIGGYTTPSTSADTYAIPDSSQGRDDLTEKARKESTFQTETDIGDSDRIVTLSTCAYEYEGARYVLVGVLRELVSTPEGS